MADRTLSPRVKSGIPLMRRAYWDALNAVLDKTGGPVTSSGKLHGQAWMTYAVVRHNFKVQAVLNIAERRIRSQLYIGGGSAKMSFHLLCEQKDAIERDLGYQLGWEERPDNLYSRIVDYNRGVDPTDRQDWPYQHQWLAERLNNMHRVFVDRVRNLRF